MKVNILGTDYQILVKKYDEDEAFERRSIDGYCNSLTKEIVVCDLNSKECWKYEPQCAINTAHKEILRHEIIHAFFSESGLQDSALAYDGGWAKNEEMVDWIALQGLKLYEAWKSADAI